MGASSGFPSVLARLAALPAWVHHYNHHRPHSSIGKVSPITRLNNLPGQHSWHVMLAALALDVDGRDTAAAWQAMDQVAALHLSE